MFKSDIVVDETAPLVPKILVLPTVRRGDTVAAEVPGDVYDT